MFFQSQYVWEEHMLDNTKFYPSLNVEPIQNVLCFGMTMKWCFLNNGYWLINLKAFWNMKYNQFNLAYAEYRIEMIKILLKDNGRSVDCHCLSMSDSWQNKCYIVVCYCQCILRKGLEMQNGGWCSISIKFPAEFEENSSGCGLLSTRFVNSRWIKGTQIRAFNYLFCCLL